MAIQVPALSFADIEKAALWCLSHAHPNVSIPVPIEDIIDVGYRIDVVPTSDLEAKFSTVAFISHDLQEIFVDEFVYKRQPYRLRFSLAHELGHLILHQQVYQQLSFSTPTEWKGAMGHLGQSNYREMEEQADCFAGLLLVPTSQFRAQFNQVANTLAEAGTSFNRLPKQSQDYAVKSMAKIFDVSSGTIWFRLRDEGLT